MNDMAFAQYEAGLLRAALQNVRSAAEAGTLDTALKALVLVLERLPRDGDIPERVRDVCTRLCHVGDLRYADQFATVLRAAWPGEEAALPPALAHLGAKADAFDFTAGRRFFRSAAAS